MSTANVQTTPTPQNYSTIISNLCSLGMRPYLMTGILVDLMRRHFVNVGSSILPYVENPDVRQLLWQGQDTTDILIEALMKWEPQTTGKRPAIIVARNDYQNQKVGIGNRLLGNSQDAQGYEHYETFWVGSHTLFCLAENGAQADLLATEVQRELTQYARPIANTLQLFRFAPYSLGKPILLEESQQHIAVPVTVGVAYAEKWTLRTDALPLRAVSLTALLPS